MVLESFGSKPFQPDFVENQLATLPNFGQALARNRALMASLFKWSDNGGQ